MKNLWSDFDLVKFLDEFALLVFTSRLLVQDLTLVLQGARLNPWGLSQEGILVTKISKLFKA